jgi:centrosomal protein CEP290
MDLTDDQLMQLVAPIVEQEVGRYKAEISELRDRLRVYEAGPQISTQDAGRYEQQINELRDENGQLARRLRELEGSTHVSADRVRELENKLQRANMDISADTREKKRLNDKIDELQQQIEELNSGRKNQMGEMMSFITEKNRLSQDNEKLIRQNDEMAAAIEELLALREEMMGELQSAGDRIADAEQMLEQSRARCRKFEREIIRLREKLPKGEVTLDIGEETMMPVEDVGAELESVQRQNAKLQGELEELRDADDRASQMLAIVEERNRTIENLQHEIEIRTDEIAQFNRAKSELITQVETYRRHLEERTRDHKAQYDKDLQDLESYRSQYNLAQAQLNELKKAFECVSRELDEARGELQKYERGTYGLTEAVQQIRDLRAMIEVRDGQIAKLVFELNAADTMLRGLARCVDPDFDWQAFADCCAQEDDEEDRRKLRRAEEDLQRKLELLRSREQDRPPEFHIQIAKDRPEPVRPFRRRRGGEDSGGEGVVIPSGQQHTKGRQLYKPDKGPRRLVVASRKKGSATGSAPGSPRRSEGASQSEELPDGDIAQSAPAIDLGSRDEWVIDLRRNYLEVQRERDELRMQLARLRMEYDNLLNDFQGLLAESDSGRKTPSARLHALSSMSGISLRPDRSVLQSPTAVNLPRLELSECTNVVNAKPRPVRLQIGEESRACYTEAGPDPIEAVEARGQFLADELAKVQRELSHTTRALEDAGRQVTHLEAMLRLKEETIVAIGKRLEDEQEAHRQKVRNLTTYYQTMTDAQLEDQRSVRAVSQRGAELPSLPVDEGNEDVGDRLAKLNRMNERLERELTDEKANAQLAQRSVAALTEKVKELEADIARLRQDLQKAGDRDMELHKLERHNQEVRLRFKKLERDYEALREKNEVLKRGRQGSEYGTETKAEHAIDASDSEEGAARDPRRVRADAARLTTLKIQNEEMVAKLGNANATIERLNQLVQRKEALIARLKEQASDFKQQVIQKQKEVSSLRARLAPGARAS